MKKVLILVLLFCSIIYAQSLDTLVIPEDYNSLKSKYIKLAQMYVEQKDDLNKALKANETLDLEVSRVIKEHNNTIAVLTDVTIQYENSIVVVSDLKKENEKLIKRLEESNDKLVSYDSVRIGFGFKYGKSIITGNTSYTIENNYLLFNKVYGSIELSYPLEARVGLGIYIN